ncbi:MAG: VCBS repeat-containing protein [Planctomycetes bacterium]|nr:VCBS repeat-containing protein [Planctomycetota bacterium]
MPRSSVLVPGPATLPFVLFAAAIVVANASAAQECTPFPARVVDVGWGPGQALTIDLDLDGDRDLAIAQTFDARVVLFTNDGAGRLALTGDLSFVDAVYSFSMADVDGDSLLDVVAWEFSDFTNEEHLTLRRGTGVATTLLSAPIQLHAFTCPPALVDLEGDGDLDIVVARERHAPGGAALEVLVDIGGGVYVPSSALQVLGSAPSVVALVSGDVDGDGDVDLAARVQGVGMEVWSQLPGGSWSTPTVTGPAGDVPGGIVSADFDGDGVADLAVLHSSTAALVQTATASATLPVGPRARGLVAADADGDGDTDLIVLADGLQVWTNQSGAFTSGPVHAVPPSADAIVAADFDGNLRADFASTCLAIDALALHLGNAESDYAPPVHVATPAVARIDGADLDGDGDVDLLVEHSGALPDEVRRNDGQGVFTPVAVLPGAGPYRVLDVDGDGVLDVLARGTSAISLARGTAAPFVFNASSIAVPAPFVRGFAAGDLEPDGDVDLVVAADSGGSSNPALHVFLQAAGAFGAPTTLAMPIGAGAVELRDVDGDGDLDVFVGGIPRLDLVRNQGAGTFAAPVSILAPASNVTAFTVGDLDLDGDVDVLAGTLNPRALTVLANDGAGNFTLVEQRATAHTPWDLRLARLDDDGAPDVLVLEHQNVQPFNSCASVWKNRGDGRFELAGRHSPGPLNGAIAAIDVDADARLDVLLGVAPFAGTPSGFAVLRNGGSCPTGASLCGGDGSATACPCANAGESGRGCANSVVPAGAKLEAAGRARVATDDLTLTTSGLPPTTLVLFLQGDVPDNGGMGAIFGDGLSCVAGTLRVLGVRRANGGVAALGANAPQPVSLAQVGALPPLGGTRYYQARYRNAASYCSAATFNTSNALRVAWGD